MLRRLAVLSGLGTGSLWCWWQIRALGDVRLQLGAFYGYFAAAFLLYLASLWLIGRWAAVSPSRTAGWLAMGLVAVVALIPRLWLLPTAPALTDDIYRYRWDGKVQLAGIDPYRYAPNDPALDVLRDELSAQINFPHLRTVYPPLTQAAFRLGASPGDSLTSHKLVFVSCELLTIASLLFVLRRRRLSPLWVAAYAWHPLVILEIAGSGHNDALGVAMLWLGIAACPPTNFPSMSKRPTGWHELTEAPRDHGGWKEVGGWAWACVALAWAGAFLAKFLSVILVPWWWCRRSGRGWLGVMLALAAVPLALRFSCVTALVESLSAMTTRFESNASLYVILAWLTRSPDAARVLALLIGVGWMAWWARREADPVKYVLATLAAAALLSPVLHPWYLVWLIPSFCLWRPAALVALTGTVVLAYTVWPGRLATGAWAMPVWAHIVEYLPVFLLLLWPLARTMGTGTFLKRYLKRYQSPFLKGASASS